jgi:hypothetical protein
MHNNLERNSQRERASSSPRGLIEDKGHEKRILDRLQSGEWVSALDLSAISLQYCARICTLRRKLAEEGVFAIENRLEINEGRRRGFYRLKRLQPPQSVLFPDLTPAKWRDPEERWAR